MTDERTGTGTWAWLTSIGTHEDPVKLDWRVDDARLLTSVWFSEHPNSIRAGDVLVYYAVGHEVLPAIVEVVSDEVLHDGGQLGAYRMAVRPIVTVGLRDAPAVNDTSIDPRSMHGQSHMYIHPRRFQVARHFILGGASKTVFEQHSSPAAA